MIPRDPKPTDAITVWHFYDAPVEYQRLSTNGGDEDWLAFVPATFAGHYVGWLESTGFDSCCEPQRFPVEGGVVWIGSHA